MTLRLSRSTVFGLAAPGLLGLAILVAAPVVILFILSMCAWHSYEPAGQFIGFENYSRLLQSGAFWEYAALTAKYTILTVGLQLVLSLAGAVALLRLRRFAGPLLVAILLPYVLPTVLVAFIWRWMLDPSIGIVNAWGASLGLIPRDFNWISKDHMLMTLVLVGTWQFFPFALMMLYARLVSIPRTRFEAAAIDGYSPAQTFVRVTLIEIMPVLAVVALLRSLFMATKFDAVWLLGGREAAGRWAQTLPVAAYRSTFDSQDAGAGATISIMLLALLLGVSGLTLGIAYARRSHS